MYCWAQKTKDGKPGNIDCVFKWAAYDSNQQISHKKDHELIKDDHWVTQREISQV